MDSPRAPWFGLRGASLSLRRNGCNPPAVVGIPRSVHRSAGVRALLADDLSHLEPSAMTANRLNSVVGQLRTLAAPGECAHLGDAELLGRFVARLDENAFETLLRRHGPMVLRVARRSLGCTSDTDDVLQATFLLLARKAAIIRKPASLAS